MSRRDRIRARIIYDRRALLLHLVWFPPLGWLTQLQAKNVILATSYGLRTNGFNRKSGVPWHLYEMQARSLRELYEAGGIADTDQPEASDKPDSHKP